MQASHLPQQSPASSNSYCDDFSAQLKLKEFDEEPENSIELTTSKVQILLQDYNDEVKDIYENEDEEEKDYDDDDDQDFSFACSIPDTSSETTADDIFQNGQIMPVFPLFNQDLLRYLSDDVDSEKSSDSHVRLPPVRNIFIETKDRPRPPSSETDVATGPFCEWSKGKAIAASPEICKKSNSTGFSKLWRFGDFMNRSHSDGRDAFVFLNHSKTSTTTVVKRSEGSSEKIKSIGGETKVVGKGVVGERVVKGKKKGVKTEPSSLSAYMKNREQDKRRSYLPYKPEVMGFFTNVNGGLSRNVHPF